jgi:hypothetical protein
MQKIFCMALALLLCLATMPMRVMGQLAITEVAGMVVTSQGNPIAGVRIVARNSSGKVISEAVTDSRGQYAVRNLAPDRYQITLDPLNSPFKGQTVVSAVGTEGLTVNWMVSPVAPALAMAAVGASGTGTPDGWSPEVIGALVVLGGAAVLLGMATGVGANSDKRRGPVSSPSQ